MQGDQEPGRGIYVVRRILVALVVLLLLVLLLPRACDALFTSGNEQDSEAPETADVESPSDGDEEETVTEEEDAPVQEEIAEREEVTVSGYDEDATSEEALEDEGGGVANIQLEAVPLGPVTGLGGIPGGGEVVGIPQEVPVVSTGLQEPIPPPIAPPEPILVGEPLVPEPFYFGEPLYFGEPIYFEEPVVYEEPTLLVQEPPDSGAAVDSSVGTTAQAGSAFAGS